MNMLIGFLKRYLLSRAGSTAVGLVVLLGLVWFGGPYVGLTSVAWRLVVIGVIVAIAGLYMLIGWWIARSRGERFRKELAAQGEADESRQAEIQALKEKMDEAVASLKTSGLGVKHRGSAALYALPWYMIIGPSAAGKSTLLRNSGLHFPYSHADDIDIRGFGGTRNCDWWFSDEAVILDTAGRYTTEENDHEEWQAFLGLLKKYRRRMPLNGVMVAISLADILTADAESLEWHVKVIRERIEELISQLGFMFPIYIIFTKADLLNGFEAFFGDLTENERNQVWGMFLADLEEEADPAAAVARRLDELYVRLSEMRLHKLAMQRKQEIKSEIFDFPAQFQAASEKLIEFISLLFKENPYQETPNFKGVYFTSGTQEGMPLQRVVGNLRQAFGYVSPDEMATTEKADKSYFIHRLLKDVIFREPVAFGKNRRRHLMTRWLKTGAIVGGLATIVASITLLSTSFTSNSLLIDEGVERVERLVQVARNDRAEPGEFYLALADVYDQYATLKAYRQQMPWHLRLGIYRANEQIEPLEQVLVRTLETRFLEPVARLLETRLQDYAERWRKVRNEDESAKLRQEYYDTLKVYLMLSQPARLEPDQALPLLLASWQAIMAPNDGSDTRRRIATIPQATREGMIRLYLADMKRPSQHPLAAASWKADDGVVETARNLLRTPPNADLLYAQLRNKGKVLLGTTQLKNLIKGRGNSYLQSLHDLPVVFTRKGWERYVSREIRTVVNSASRGDWVLGTESVNVALSADEAAPADDSVNPELMHELETQIRHLYFEEYANAWYEFLASVQVRPFTSVADAANKLLLVSRSDGPIAELLAVVRDNVNLHEIDWQDGKPTVRRSNLVAADAIPELDTAFADLRRFVEPAEKRQVSDLVNQYLLALSGMQGELERLRASSELTHEAEMFASSMLSGGSSNLEMYKTWVTTTSLLNGTDVRTRRAIEPLLISAIRHAWQAVLATGMQDVQQKWNTLVVREFDERIRGRFPFASSGPDVAIEDVAEFFRPNDGILWSFVNTHLSTYLTKYRGTWRERRWLDVGPGFSKDFLYTLTRASQITRGLFRRGSDEPSLTFYLYPIPTSGLSEVLLETNGQIYRYRNEPQEWRKFRWPGNTERSGARVIAVSNRRNARGEIAADGVWGLFHVFRKARMVRERGAQYMTTWELESVNGQPLEVRFRIKADRHNNLLKPGLLTGLDMPDLFDRDHAGPLNIAKWE